jgi:hypothetical protein
MKARLLEQRGKVRDALTGFVAWHWSEGRNWPELEESAKLRPMDCRAAGVYQGLAIIDELRAGRPVAVSMELKGLQAWGSAGSQEHAYHAFLITGFEKKPGEDALLRVRNSWRGKNPDVREDELCRVYDIISVLAPGEPEPKAR